MVLCCVDEEELSVSCQFIGIKNMTRTKQHPRNTRSGFLIVLQRGAYACKDKSNIKDERDRSSCINIDVFMSLASKLWFTYRFWIFLNLYHQHMSFHRTSIICWLITCHRDQVFYKYFTNFIFIFGLTGAHCLQNYFTSGTWYHQIQGNSDEVIFSFLWWNDCSVTGWGVNCRFEEYFSQDNGVTT